MNTNLRFKNFNEERNLRTKTEASNLSNEQFSTVRERHTAKATDPHTHQGTPSYSKDQGQRPQGFLTDKTTYILFFCSSVLYMYVITYISVLCILII